MAKQTKTPAKASKTELRSAEKNAVKAVQQSSVAARRKAIRRPKALNGKDIVPDALENQVGGFVNFVREHAIVGLAVGFIIGQQAQGIIKQLVTSFIDPAFQLFFGKKLSERTFTLHVGERSADFGWGGMVYVLLNLLFVLLVIYLLLKIFNLDKLDQKKQN